MFTGLISETGTISWIKRRPGGIEYHVCCSRISERLVGGASIAVDGVCQTVCCVDETGFTSEAVESTLRKTTIGRLSPGARVNLEPALCAGDPLDGHLMQGHVQKVGRLDGIREAGIGRVFEISVENPLELGIIVEGSVGIDGVSLTVSSIKNGRFTVHIIPETWERTTLKVKRRGDFLNIEGDLLVRAGGSTEMALSENKLIEWGY